MLMAEGAPLASAELSRLDAIDFFTVELSYLLPVVCEEVAVAVSEAFALWSSREGKFHPEVFAIFQRLVLVTCGSDPLKSKPPKGPRLFLA